MVGLLQRVSGASVSTDGKLVAEIDTGLLVLIGIEKNDSEDQAQRLFEKLIRYRVFFDDSGKMNRSLTDIAGGLLLVPQFTLAADTTRGNRPMRRLLMSYFGSWYARVITRMPVRDATGGFWLALAISTKVYPVVLVPFFVLKRGTPSSEGGSLSTVGKTVWVASSRAGTAQGQFRGCRGRACCSAAAE